MPAPWGDGQFDFYETQNDRGDRVFVTLDLEAAQHAPVASHPIWLQIRVAMLHPREDGLRASEEADALFALEDKIVAGMEAAAEAIYVGRVVMQGYTEFFFYVPGSKREAADEPPAAIGAVAPYELEWFTEPDAEWAEYALLHPNAFAMQTIMNRRLQQTMAENGDQLAVPREVDHLVVFPDKDKADKATAALEKKGFRCDAADQRDDGWALQFHRRDRCDDGHPDDFVAEIFEIIGELEGDYDGWGSLLQLAEPEKAG